MTNDWAKSMPIFTRKAVYFVQKGLNLCSSSYIVRLQRLFTTHALILTENIVNLIPCDIWLPCSTFL